MCHAPVTGHSCPARHRHLQRYAPRMGYRLLPQRRRQSEKPVFRPDIPLQCNRQSGLQSGTVLLIEERHFIYRLIKLQIQSITEAPVEVLRAGFCKDVKLMSIIPGKLKGQPHQLSFKFIRSANRLPMHPSSTLRPVVEQDELNPNQMPLLPLLWELFPFPRGSCR